MEFSKETGLQAPENPILCINNCGFFGSAATMNMCSKCHKDTIWKQQQSKLAMASVESIIHSSQKQQQVSGIIKFTTDQQFLFGSSQNSGVDMKVGSKRCTSCNKHVGLLGFECRCGKLFCSIHRYSDKHSCPFDYRGAARDAIARDNPLVKAKKVDKI